MKLHEYEFKVCQYLISSKSASISFQQILLVSHSNKVCQYLISTKSASISFQQSLPVSHFNKVCQYLISTKSAIDVLMQLPTFDGPKVGLNSETWLYTACNLETCYLYVASFSNKGWYKQMLTLETVLYNFVLGPILSQLFMRMWDVKLCTGIS